MQEPAPEQNLQYPSVPTHLHVFLPGHNTWPVPMRSPGNTRVRSLTVFGLGI